MPTLRQRPGTIQQDWHYKPPDQPALEQSQRVPKFPTFPKRTATTVQRQPPPGQQPELTTAPRQPILPLQQIPESTTELSQPPVQVQQPPPQPQVRRRITTKTTPSKNDLLATIDTGVLHLSTNEDAEEKKLSTDNMILQDWYDDDNEDYDAYELKTVIKEEHDALQKTQVFTRVNSKDYSPQQLKDVIQTKWVIRSRPGGKTKRLKALFVAKGFTQKANLDEIYAATPAAITLRMHSSTHQYNQEQHYLSNHHQNASKTTAYSGNSTNNSTDFVTRHKSSNNTYHQYSSNLVYDNYGQINVSTTTMTSQ
eukprot:3598768-Amphidinium_carterae.2